MKAIPAIPIAGRLLLIDQPELTTSTPDEIMIQIKQVGICGIDRDKARAGRAVAPEHQEFLVFGHQMLGKVVETGKNFNRVKTGDLAVLTIRRGCGKYQICFSDHPELCQTCEHIERGIKGLDDYQTEYVIDLQNGAVRLQSQLGYAGVLTEPLSVAEKAIDSTTRAW